MTSRHGRSVVVLLRRAERLRVVIVFVDLPVSILVFLFFICLSFWIWLCCGSSLFVVSGGLLY
jgi:hypothetical protein